MDTNLQVLTEDELTSVVGGLVVSEFGQTVYVTEGDVIVGVNNIQVTCGNPVPC